MRAIRNVPITSARVRARLAAIFGEVPITYPTETSDPAYKVDGTGAINGAGIPVQVPTVASGNTAQWILTFLLLDEEGEAEENSTLTMLLNDADATVLLEDKVAGGSAGAGGEITISGKVYHPFGDGVPYASGFVNVALVERFATEDGIYLAVDEDIKISLGDLNGGGGLVLYVPTGSSSEWLFTFPDGSTATAFLGTHTSMVEIADIANGDYVTAITPMDAPTAFSAVQDGADVDLTWSDESADETLFRIERSDDDGATWDAVTTTAADAESYTDTSVPDGNYIYRIRAEKSGGQSAWTTDTLTVAPIPDAPSNLTAVPTGATNHQVLLNWDDNSDNETGFIVEYRADSGGSWVELTTTAANTETYTHTPTLGITTHYYRVRAEGVSGQSANATADIDDLALGLVAAWTQEEDGSGNRLDLIGSSDAIKTGTVPEIAGLFGFASQFDASGGDYLEVTDNAAISMGVGLRMTLVSFVRLNAGATTHDNEFMNKRSNSVIEWIFRVGSGTTLQFFVTSDGTGGTLSSINHPTSLSASTWYMASAKYDGANIGVSLNGGAFTTTAFSADVYDGAVPLRFGANADDTADSRIDGDVGQSLFYKRALSATNLTRLWNGGAGLDITTVLP